MEGFQKIRNLKLKIQYLRLCPFGKLAAGRAVRGEGLMAAIAAEGHGPVAKFHDFTDIPEILDLNEISGLPLEISAKPIVEMLHAGGLRTGENFSVVDSDASERATPEMAQPSVLFFLRVEREFEERILERAVAEDFRIHSPLMTYSDQFVVIHTQGITGDGYNCIRFATDLPKFVIEFGNENTVGEYAYLCIRKIFPGHDHRLFKLGIEKGFATDEIHFLDEMEVPGLGNCLHRFLKRRKVFIDFGGERRIMAAALAVEIAVVSEIELNMKRPFPAFGNSIKNLYNSRQGVSHILINGKREVNSVKNVKKTDYIA